MTVESPDSGHVITLESEIVDGTVVPGDRNGRRTGGEHHDARKKKKESARANRKAAVLRRVLMGEFISGAKALAFLNSR